MACLFVSSAQLSVELTTCFIAERIDATHLPLVQVVCRPSPEELLPPVCLGAEGKSGLGQAERVGVELLDGILGFAFPLGLVR